MCFLVLLLVVLFCFYKFLINKTTTLGEVSIILKKFLITDKSLGFSENQAIFFFKGYTAILGENYLTHLCSNTLSQKMIVILIHIASSSIYCES